MTPYWWKLINGSLTVPEDSRILSKYADSFHLLEKVTVFHEISGCHGQCIAMVLSAHFKMFLFCPQKNLYYVRYHVKNEFRDPVF